MKFEIKDPGSAITHFIGMMMALFASTPLLIRAANNPDRIHLISLAVFITSMVLLYMASTVYHTLNLSERSNRILRKIDHMMIFVLIAGSYTPVCLVVLGKCRGIPPVCPGLGHCPCRHFNQSFLDHLSQMVFFPSIYCHGVGLRAGFYPDFKFPAPGGFRVAPGRRNHLHHRRNHLRSEAADF